MSVVDPGYYVYVLRDATGPFYVGKGRGGRVASHMGAALRGRRGPLYDRLRAIARTGLAYAEVIVAHNLTETQALDLESSLLYAFAPLPCNRAQPGPAKQTEIYGRRWVVLEHAAAWRRQQTVTGPRGAH
jgi:hypothetical protein